MLVASACTALKPLQNSVVDPPVAVPPPSPSLQPATRRTPAAVRQISKRRIRESRFQSGRCRIRTRGEGRQILQTSVRYADTLSLTALNFAIVAPSTPVDDLPAAWSASVCWTWTKVGQSLDSSGGGEIFATLAATSLKDGLGLVEVL